MLAPSPSPSSSLPVSTSQPVAAAATWKPARKRRARRHLARAFGTTSYLVWPALFAMPAGALALSWWLGVL